MPAAIRTVDLTKTYRSGEAELVIFEGLNFEVEQGEKLALVGESGAGKSTLLHLLGGLDTPTRVRYTLVSRTSVSFRAKSWRNFATGSWVMCGRFIHFWPSSRPWRT